MCSACASRQVEELLAGRQAALDPLSLAAVDGWGWTGALWSKLFQATLVLSDLAPKMIGSAIDDHVASVELSKKALRWALHGAQPSKTPPPPPRRASAFSPRKFLRAEGCLAPRPGSTQLCLASPMSPPRGFFALWA